MILDASLVFDPPATPITAGGASTNVIDSLDFRDTGVGQPLKLLVLASAAFSPAGPTLNIQLQGSVDSSTWTTFAESGPLSAAQLTNAFNGVGQPLIFAASLPGRAPGAAPPRYYRLNYVVAGGPFTAGAVGASLTIEVQSFSAYPAGVAVFN